MPIPRSLKPLAALLVATTLLALPAAAQATLTFVRNPAKPVVFTAADDGSGVHRVGPGNSPQMAPDGESVAYLHEAPGHKAELELAPVRGGASRTLMVGWREPFVFAFSPDSTMIAALRGGELGRRKLVLIDIATGSQRVLASGYFGGVSFSPEGDELVYSKATSEKYPPRTDVYRVAVAGGKPVALTHDHVSEDPLWGPTGKIVFVRQLEASRRRYGPKNELYLMNPQGKAVKRLTHTRVPPLLEGLSPTAWSASGNQLLAEFGGQDTSYAVRVNPATGAQKPVGKAGRAGEFGFVGTALSSDGRTVLGVEGALEPGGRQRVVTVPYAGGSPTVLAKNAFEPAWSL